jgi:C4-dicarboxylate-specific signal transduction histidine kinase
VERLEDPNLPISADPARIHHALRLTLLNAALSSGAGKVCIETSVESGRVHVCIDDLGDGISADLAGALGKPFEARKPPGIGDALALFVASRLVAELDGELVLTPRSRGTRIELRLARP